MKHTKTKPMEQIGFLIRVFLIFSLLPAAYCLVYLAIRQRGAARLEGNSRLPSQVVSTAYLFLAFVVALGPLAFLADRVRHASDISVR